ncbi:MAG: HupE/UreJ family protein [Polaromonas sp.]
MMRELGHRCKCLQAFWRLAIALGFGLGLSLACAPALAHKGSDAYLDVQQQEQAGSQDASGDVEKTRDFRFLLAVAIRDLDMVVPLDANADASITWGEVKAATPQVLVLLDQVAQLDVPASPSKVQTGCALHWQADGLERRSDGVYLRASAQARCPLGQALRFNYSLLKEQDATHRLLVTGHIGGKDLLSTMSPQQGSVLLAAKLASASNGDNAQAPADQAGRWSTLRDYFSLGMHHLLEGYDHLAFLLALVLPLQLSLRRRSLGVSGVGRAGHAGVAGDWRANWLALLRTVTAFTVGHSITLMLATFGWTQASPLWVEPAIALSIVVTALLNLYPVKWIRFDVLALLFGLIHGFGFAGLLLEAAAPSGLLPWALTGFNLGVEAGQLTAVLAWVLVSQALVGKPWYPGLVVRGGSVALLLLATGWFWQRVS